MENSEDEGVKEVFAHFGLAYYLAGVFESGLALAILKLDFLTQQRQQAELRRGAPFDREAFNTRYDAFLEGQQAKTLGNLIRRLRELIDLPTDFGVELDRVKQRRDFIAHHFFRERAEQFQNAEGRAEMIGELRADQALFEKADQELTVLLEPYEAKIGINKQALEKYVASYLDGMRRAADPGA